MPEAVVEVERLAKTYPKGARGVDDVSFDVRRGEVFGSLGPNGAGKTTTMRVLMDVLRPTSGRARVLGLDPRADRLEVHRRVGYVPGDLGLASRDTVRDHLRYHARLRGVDADARIDELARRLELDLARPVKALSRGNRQKVGLVQALLAEPELLILDEPTAGLDPLMQQEFNRLIAEAKARGATVFLSSHILPEVEHLCDRVGIIRAGKLVAVEDVASLKARAIRRVEARFRGAADASLVQGVEGVLRAEADGRALRLDVRGDLGPLVRALATPDLADLLTREPTLEDIFLAYYGGDA